MQKLREVDGMILLVEGKDILGCVTRCNDTQWAFTPLVPGASAGVKYIPLHYALEEALKFDRKDR